MATDLGKISQTTNGEYEEGKVYERLDTVSADGSSYISRKNNNIFPLSNPEAWQISALKGDKGDKGNPGENLTLEYNDIFDI